MSVVPQLDMSGVLVATANPDGRQSWVELADGNVCERRGDSILPTVYGVSPSRRLYLVDGASSSAAVRQEVVVWSEGRLSHCQKERDGAEEITTVEAPRPLLLGGAAESGARPEHFVISYAATDRRRAAVALSAADVHHFYQIQMSWAWRGPHRTLIEGGVRFDALAHPTLSVEKVRLNILGGISDSCLRRASREVLWRVVVDDLQVGRRTRGCSASCSAPGSCGANCVMGLCRICAHAAGSRGKRDGELREYAGDSARHRVLGCPRATLLLDALARAYAGAVGWDTGATPTAQSLLREVGAAMVTGFQGGSGKGAEPFRVLVSEATVALARAAAQDSKAGVLAFGVERAYADVVCELERVADLSLRWARKHAAWQSRWFGERRDESSPGPLQKWKGAWVGSGVVDWDEEGAPPGSRSTFMQATLSPSWSVGSHAL